MQLKLRDEIPFAKGLTLNLSAITTRFAHLGNIGSGKSYGAMKLAEGMMDCGGQVVALDPVGIWYGLRLLPSGKPSGYEIPIFGGLHGDVPLEATAGHMIADLIVDRRINAILDLSMFETDVMLHRFASSFAERFFFRKKQSRTPVHLMIEEGQELLPQNPQATEVMTLHRFQRMLKIGRNFGIGASIISQRPQEVHKKVLNLSECVICYQLNGRHERAAMKEWIVDKGLDESLLDLLPTVPVGNPYIWSPRWLKVMDQYHVLQKHTADVSSTPELGDPDHFETVKLSDKELADLGDKIKATVDHAKANDPVELNKEVHKLRAELDQKSKALVQMEGRVKVTTKQVSVLTEKDYTRFSTAANNISAQVSKIVAPLLLKLGQVAPATPIPTPIAPPEDRSKPNPNFKPATFRTDTFGVVKIGPPPKELGDKKLSKAEMKILRVIVQYPGSERKKIAVMSGYARTGGSFINSMGSLRTAALITGGVDGNEQVYSTSLGAMVVGELPPLPTGEDLYKMWTAQLKTHVEREILRVLWENRNRKEMTKAEIGALTISKITNEPYEITGGSFINGMGALRTRDIIEGYEPIKLAPMFHE